MQPGKDENTKDDAQPLAEDQVMEETPAGDAEVAPDEAEVAREEAEPDLSPAEILQAERDRFEEKWLRAVAEMDNIRKRSRREVVDSRRFAQADVLRAFLGVLDNIERALAVDSADESGAGHDSFRSGVELVSQQYHDILKDMGVTPIKAMDTEFDPMNHEAVGQLERDGAESGHVIEIVQQGFMFGDMVLRPARVIIAS